MPQISVIVPTQINQSSLIKDFSQLVKFRLTMMVVFSTGVGFLMATTTHFQWISFLILMVSGFLITGAANGINQIIERDLDKLMTRTQNRPIAQGRLSVRQAVFSVTLMSLLGVVLLGTYINALSALIGGFSLLLYAFVYTPLKRKGSVSVWVGAIAGAAPPLIGYTAVTGTIDATAWVLFSIQLVWQLPHFWALAWVLNDEYNKAGFYLLPFKSGRSQSSATITLVSALGLLPLVYISYYLGITNGTISVLMLLVTLNFIYQSYQLWQTLEMSAARKLMFGSFYYLPLVQILLIIAHYLK
jgi:protoheme IX farnesyltransferase